MDEKATMYTTEAIQVLEWHEAVRKRPGMYVGDTTDGSGLHHLLWQLVDTVVEQHEAGYASELKVELCDSWIIVRDDGPGMPTVELPIPEGRTRHDHEPTTALESLLLQLHSTSRWSHCHPPVRLWGGLHGTGIGVVNALCDQLVVETTDQGVRWIQTFERGRRATHLRRLAPTTLEGTTIRCRPDPAIFGATTLDHGRVLTRLQQLAWLHPHLRIWFQERRLVSRGGIAGWTYLLARERGEVVETFSLAQATADIRVAIALSWNREGTPLVRSFVNTHATTSGSHLDGFWLGFAEYARKMKSPARSVRHVREAIGCGLVAVVNVDMMEACFTSQDRTTLKSQPAAQAVSATVLASLNDGWNTWRIRQFVDERLRSKSLHR